ncbi:hypothetical protein G6F62_015399 [Rhizopus arrhizus]|nr:hypothetical protein G6F62_015399 [Rhizopus arrhizus]
MEVPGGVVHQDVQRAVALDRGFYGVPDLLVDSDVGLHGQDLQALRRQRRHGAVQPFLVSARHHHLGAQARIGRGDLQSYAAPASRYQRHLSFQHICSKHRFLLFRLCSRRERPS